MYPGRIAKPAEALDSLAISPLTMIPAKAGTHLGSRLDVLRLSTRLQTLWDALHWHDSRSRTQDLGTQAQGRSGFTRRYNVNRLVWFEVHQSSETALRREKQLKEWKRDWKINLIERDNPHWIDLSPTLSA